MEIISRKCDLCGKSNFKRIYVKQGYNLWKCDNCALIFVYPQPSDKELLDIYSYKTGYFEHTDFEEGTLNPFFERVFKKNKKGNFLDVGCGTEHIVYTAKMCGWNAEGIDLNKGAVEKARKKGLDIKCINIDDFRGKGGNYDIIHMGDLIEHVSDIEKTIKTAYKLLKMGGKLIISTPNINSFFPKYSFVISQIFRITWSHPSPPYHLFEFSNENFPEFLKQQGFKLEDIDYSSISLAYSIGNTGLFKNFKEEYRKNKSILKSLKRNNLLNSLLMAITFMLYLPGYLISTKLKIKDEMRMIFIKNEGN